MLSDGLRITIFVRYSMYFPITYNHGLLEQICYYQCKMYLPQWYNSLRDIDHHKVIFVLTITEVCNTLSTGQTWSMSSQRTDAHTHHLKIVSSKHDPWYPFWVMRIRHVPKHLMGWAGAHHIKGPRQWIAKQWKSMRSTLRHHTRDPFHETYMSS